MGRVTLRADTYRVGWLLKDWSYYCYFFFNIFIAPPLQVLSAGSEPYVFHWSLNGELKAQIPCTPTYVYKVDVNTTSESNKVILKLFTTFYTFKNCIFIPLCFEKNINVNVYKDNDAIFFMVQPFWFQIHTLQYSLR